MKTTLLKWLACPDCRGELHLTPFRQWPEFDGVGGFRWETDEGVLGCACGQYFPVEGGVPRMLPGALFSSGEFRTRWNGHLKALGALSERALRPPPPEFRDLLAPTMERFGKEWQLHPLEEKTWSLDQETRLTHALRYLGWTASEAKGKVVLDAGCGTSKLTCGMTRWKGEVVGVDLSPSCIRGWLARQRLAGDRSVHVHVVQGNLMSPPFREGSFDGVHSAGVLHHTPETRRAFRAVAPLVKPGGALGVWLYREGLHRSDLPWLPLVRARWAVLNGDRLRKFTPRMNPDHLHALLKAYATVFHFFYALSARMRGRNHDQTIRERTTSLFDSFAPPFVWRHTPEEVTPWFEEAGYTGIRETTIPEDTAGFCMTATRLTPTPTRSGTEGTP